MAMQINDVAKIYTADGFYLMAGRFIAKDEESIHLAVKPNDLLQAGQSIKVVLTSEAYGLLPFRCSVTEDSILPPRFAIQQYVGLNLKIEEALPSVQRRKDIKVNLEHKAAEVALLDLVTGKPYGKSCEGYIKDISASGLLFATKEELVENQEFLLPMPYVAEGMILRAKIIRTQKEPEGYTGYGCCFVGLRTGQEEALRQYVFKAQVMQRKNRL